MMLPYPHKIKAKLVCGNRGFDNLRIPFPNRHLMIGPIAI